MADFSEEEDFGFQNAKGAFRKQSDIIDEVPSLTTSGRLRLRGDLEIDGVEYSGKKVPRNSIFPEGREGNEPQDNTVLDLGPSDFDEFDFLEDENSNQNNSEQKSDIKNLFFGNEQVEQLDLEYQMLKDEEAELMKSMKPKVEEEEQKSISVFHQRLLWDKSIELRICLQKPLSNISKLPHPEDLAKFSENNQDLANKLNNFSNSTSATLDSFLELLEVLVDQNPNIEAENDIKINENGKRERENDDDDDDNDDNDNDGNHKIINLNETWKKIDHLYQRFSKFRNNSLDKWQRKTTLNHSLNSGKKQFKALNQSISQQVSNSMRNSEKIIQRTQRKFSFDDQKNEDKSLNDDDLDPEIYNDVDFYQQILKEFIESTDTSIMGGLSSYEMSKLRNSKKKNVDRRASKGRKIRYVVHPSIVNFMAPISCEVSAISERLTSSVFGQKPVPLKL